MGEFIIIKIIENVSFNRRISKNFLKFRKIFKNEQIIENV